MQLQRYPVVPEKLFESLDPGFATFQMRGTICNGISKTKAFSAQNLVGYVACRNVASSPISPLVTRNFFGKMEWTVLFGGVPAANNPISSNLPNATSMQINISTRHGDISDATKEKITQKVEKVQRFFERLTSIDVTVDLSKADEPKIEVVVRPEKRDSIIAGYQSNDMFGSLDQIISKLEQQIKKHKEKLQERGKNVSEEV